MSEIEHALAAIGRKNTLFFYSYQLTAPLAGEDPRRWMLVDRGTSKDTKDFERLADSLVEAAAKASEPVRVHINNYIGAIVFCVVPGESCPGVQWHHHKVGFRESMIPAQAVAA